MAPTALYPRLGWTLSALGLFCFLWALFRDRARGRKRCPKCWYSMDGVPGLICPECGHDAHTPARLHKTRRRWRWIPLAALFLLVAHVTSSLPRIRNEGWLWGLTPTPVLMLATWGCNFELSIGRASGGPSRELTLRTRMSARLVYRFSRADMRHWQARALIRRWGFPIAIQLRDRWVRGVPIAAQLRFESVYFLSGGFSDLMKVTPALRPDSAATDQPATIRYSGSMINYQGPGEFVFEGKPIHFELFQPWRHDLPAPTADTREVRFNVELFKLASAPPTVWKPWWKTTISRPITIVDSVDDILKPVRGPEADAAAKAMLGFNIWPTKGQVLTWNTAPVQPALDGVSIGYRIEVLHNTEVIAWTARGYTARVKISGGVGHAGPWPLDGDLARLATADPTDPSWTVRIRGDGIESLKYLETENYWSGQFEVPLKDVLGR